MAKEAKMLQTYLESQIGFRGPLVSIDEFIDNPYYLGNVYTGVFPFWRKKLRELFPNSLTTTSSYVVLTGAIGLGKSTASKILLAYDMYKISMMRDPKKYFGIMATSGYYVKCFNITKYKAFGMVQELDNLFHGYSVADGGPCCPYFRDQMKYGNSFLRNLHVTAASRMKDLISDDVCGFILSELNDAKRELADEVLHQAENRLWSRFKNGKNLCCHLILDSSARNEGSLVDDFLKDNPNAKDAFVVRATHWESREGMGIYGAHGWFNLYLGDSRYPPFVIKNESDIVTMELDPDQVLKVPMEYYNQVMGSNGANLLTFIQDVCGRSTNSAYRFITEPDRVLDSMTLPQLCGEVIRLDFYDKYDTLYSKLEKAVLTIPTDKRLYIALDCATNHDLFGLAIGYADGLTRYNEADGGKLDYLDIKIPIAIGISRVEGQETAINKVHDFILRLADDYDIGCVFTDQYQSTELRQILIQNHVNAERNSIDVDDSAYMTFKRWLYMGLVSLPQSELVKHEILGLERVYKSNGKYKVEKPRDEISHGDTTAAIVQLVSQIVELGPTEVLSSGRMNKTKFTDILGAVNKPRVIRPMI